MDVSVNELYEQFINDCTNKIINKVCEYFKIEYSNKYKIEFNDNNKCYMILINSNLKIYYDSMIYKFTYYLNEDDVYNYYLNENDENDKYIKIIRLFNLCLEYKLEKNNNINDFITEINYIYNKIETFKIIYDMNHELNNYIQRLELKLKVANIETINKHYKVKWKY